MGTFTCRSCGDDFDSEVEATRCKPCFADHVRGLRFGFVGGGGYGRDAFRSKTIGEAQREHIEGAAQVGIKAEPVGTRWV